MSLSGRSPGSLVLLRHGQSEWNAADRSTGWVEVGLTDRGVAQARRAGELLREHGLLPDVVHTSVLKRAVRTARLALDAARLASVPTQASWRLNERPYGALQGRHERAILEEHGGEQLLRWRRSHHTAPLELADDDPWSQVGDPAYAGLPDDDVPRTESLRDVTRRLLPYWFSAIVPDLLQGHRVLVVAHGNSLRALVKHLDHISDEDIAAVDLPTGDPLAYDLDGALRPLARGGSFLDPQSAAAGISEVCLWGTPPPARRADGKPGNPGERLST